MSAPQVEAAAEDRHASWLELFFDLVAVAGIAALAHLLGEDRSNGGLALYVIAFSAIWMIWACFTIYGNIAAERVRTTVILGAMFVLGVMIAAIPGIHDEHANGFAIAYIVGRVLAGRPWQRAAVVVDLPVVHMGAGVVPWIVSLWYEGAAQHALWAVGLGIDMTFLMVADRDRLLAGGQARLDRWRASLESRIGRGERQSRHPRGREMPTSVEAMAADVPHLGERLGLFVLIVIGEGLVQIIDGAAEAEWDRPLAAASAGAFALICGLWGASVRYGFAGVPLLREAGLAPQYSWPAHLLSTLGLATVAAVAGGLVPEPVEDVSDHARWVLVAAYAGHALVGVVVHLAVGSPRGAAMLLPMLAAASVVAALETATAMAVIWVLAAGVVTTLGLRAWVEGERRSDV